MSHNPWFTSIKECSLLASADNAYVLTRSVSVHSALAASAVAWPTPPCRCASMPGLYVYARPAHSGGSSTEHPGMPIPHMFASVRPSLEKDDPNLARLLNVNTPSLPTTLAVATTPAAAATTRADREILDRVVCVICVVSRAVTTGAASNALAPYAPSFRDRSNRARSATEPDPGLCFRSAFRSSC